MLIDHSTPRPRGRSLVLGLGVFLLLGTCLAPTPRAAENDGFLYGRILSSSGTEYEGILRWGKQEAFWDDLFHSAKEDLPYRDEVDDVDVEDRRRGRVKVFGIKINWEDGGGGSRVFIARFGDIDEILVRGDEDADVVMKNGETYAVSGYADDVGGTIHVQDANMGEIDLKWDRLESIQFMPVPRDAKPGVQRLYGTVETEEGDFEGYVMWDKEECLSTDLLDGESEDGDVSLEMGRLRSIERRGRSSSIVEFLDGRTLRLRGSNDVDDDNRGILIEVEGLGKVTVEWDAFDRVVFEEAPGSGRGYEDYRPLGALHGTVVGYRDEEFTGRIVLDLDEAEQWEILNGSIGDVDFDIPLEYVAEIEPIGRDASRVLLHSGRELELEDGQDVSDRNDGVLVYTDGDRDPRYVPWEDVKLIRFEK